MNSNSLQVEKDFKAAITRMVGLNHKTPDRNDIEDMAKTLATIRCYSSVNIAACVDSIMVDIETRMPLGTSLVDLEKPHDRDWINKRSDIKWKYYEAYKEFLINDGWAPKVVETLNTVGNNILSNIQDPKAEGKWDRRGLVIGHVQSGKTANYINVVAKAADAGYKFIIVIAGLHNNLRKQTQQRIEQGFVGKSSRREDNQLPVGVGLHSQNFPYPVTITTVDSDFKRAVARQSKWQLNDFSKPIILVIKKNVITLKELHQWLQEMNADGNGQISDVPMLMIDDEADNASINTNKPDLNPTKTNSLIRRILELFAKSSYIGYTATPFANIFINPDAYDEESRKELFPNDFIYSLDAPTTYFGPDKVFMDEESSSNATVREIDDCENYIPLKHKKNDDIASLPPSLHKAIDQFIITRAIRNLRGQRNKHHSMMANVSRFTDVQDQIHSLIQIYVNSLREAVKANYSMPEPSPGSNINAHMKSLKQCFNDDFRECGFEWQEIKAELYGVFENLKIYIVNSKSDEPLDYEKYEKDGVGLTAIAVGGLSLSRGLTVEGLCISYMYRNTRMYDTLMQMGRWFGYRQGYEDLCRVYLASDSIDWYAHIAKATDELKQQIRVMKSERVSPKQFGLYVAAHPDRLLITAPNKMRSGERIKWNLNFRLREVIILPTDESINNANENMIKKFWENGFGGKEVCKHRKRGWFILNVSIDNIREFIRTFEVHDHYAFNKKAILDFIDAIKDTYEFGDVALRSIEENNENEESFTLGFQKRNTWERGADYWRSRKNRVGSANDERIGLSEAQIEEAKAEERQQNGENNEQRRLELYYRLVRNKPLLLVHILNFEHNNCKYRVPTFGISFPKDNYDKSVDIVANQRYQQQYINLMHGKPIDHVDDDGDDDD